jgi:NAD+ synthase (glutamine-hydrolysing)
LYAKLYSPHEPDRWECLTDILSGDYTDNILCSIGMPVIFNSVRYNCQVCLNRKIIMIRPKMSLANDGNYHEFRWFSAWTFKDEIVDFQLPIDVSEAIYQDTAIWLWIHSVFRRVSIGTKHTFSLKLFWL